MVFARYTFKRFSWYFIGIALFFAGLFNLIEFFEKLIRVSSATLFNITHFVVLHFGPSFVEFLPIASWLATVLIIMEYHQHRELDLFPLMMIGKKTLCYLFLINGIIAGIFTVILNEYIMVPISSQAERFRSEKLKKISRTNIRNKTMWLPDNVFTSIGFIDIEKNEGQDLTLVRLSSSFTLEQLYKIDRFKLDMKQKEIILENGYLFNTSNNTTTPINNMSYNIPSFFTTLQVHQEVPLLRTLISTAVLYRHLLSHEASLDIIQQIMKRLLFYLQIMLSPLLTILIFFLTERLRIWRWFMLVIPYGFFAGLNSLIAPLSKCHNPIWILSLIFTLTVISIMISMQKKLLI